MKWMVYSGCDGQRAAARRQGVRALGILVGLAAVMGLIACGEKVHQEQTRKETAREEQVQSGPAGMRFVLIPPGEFMMGSPGRGGTMFGDEVQHRVRLTNGFWLQTTEVTQGQWQKVMGYNLAYFMKGDNYPVESVSWNEVQYFLKKLNAMDPGKNYRLPTEAEWEYACRAGTTDEQYGELDAIAWYEGNSDGQTHPVGRKQPNAWGLYDMLGNVWEWCQDRYDGYPAGAVTDPTGPTTGSGRVYRVGPTKSSNRVYRGGGWRLNAWYCRAADRGSNLPDFRSYALGFRLARSLP